MKKEHDPEKIRQVQEQNKEHELVILMDVTANTIRDSLIHIEDALEELKNVYYSDVEKYDERCAVVNFVYNPTSHYTEKIFVDIIMNCSEEKAISILDERAEQKNSNKVYRVNGEIVDKRALYEMLKEEFDEKNFHD